MNRIVMVIIGVVRYKNKYLLTYRDEKTNVDSWANHHWQFPSGGIEFGETPEQTVKREMKEELGIDIFNLQLIPKIITKKRENWQGVLICYMCDYDRKKERKLNDEASKFGWFSAQEVRKLKTLPGTLEIVLEAEKSGRERT